jgi:hypothetical protein
MPLIIPVGFAQVTLPLLHVSQSREAVVTFGVNWDESGTGPDVCDAIMQTWIDEIGDRVDEGCVQGPVRAAIGGPDNENLQVEGTLTYGSPGTASKLPSNVSLLVRKITDRGGRRGRGRMYVPWLLNESDVNDVGVIDGTYRSSLQVSFDNWLDLLSSGPPGSSTPMQILHSTDPDQSTLPGSPNTVTSLVVDQLVATQRRRLRP